MIRIENVTKRFEKTIALQEISCTIHEGSIYGIVGSNGAGKSTLLRLLSGVYRPDGGRIMIDEQPIWENPVIKQTIAFVPDELYFLSGASLERMAALYARTYPSFDREYFARLTQAFQLDTQKPLSTFSKGMQRQAACILAIARRPQYLLLDETFDGLDPVKRRLVKNLICRDVLERKVTAILASHSLRELEDTCDQLALLHKGGLVFESDIQDLKASLFKVQIAFNDDYDRSRFAELQLLHFTKRGSVANLIVHGNREQTIERLNALSPMLLDVLPLTLDEVFTYEMEALGYHFGNLPE